MMRFIVSLLLLGLLTTFTHAQADSAFVTTIMERTAVRTGPGHTYPEVIWLGAGVEVHVLARNTIGNWLQVEREALPGTEAVEGWLRTGYLQLPEGVTFSELPVNDTLADADTSGFMDADIIRLYETPVLPVISDAMHDVYQLGQDMGNHPAVVTKVGDSNSASSVYLPPLEVGNYELGPYDFLQDAVDYFGESFRQGSIAARVGMNAFSVFDPVWAGADCDDNEAPLLCEYRLTKPAVALVMFGPNDLLALNTEQYREQMTRIVEESLAQGVIPVLSTFVSRRDADTWFQAVRFNLILLDIAAEYEVPLINLWSAVRGLPYDGIGTDDVHLTAAGASVDLDSGHESRYGISLQNLIVLHTLERIRELIVSSGI